MFGLWWISKNSVKEVTNWALSWENRSSGFPTRSGLYSHKKWLEAWNFGFRKWRDCTIRLAKTKALISFAVTASWSASLFSHMQNFGFLMTRLILFLEIRISVPNIKQDFPYFVFIYCLRMFDFAQCCIYYEEHYSFVRFNLLRWFNLS